MPRANILIGTPCYGGLVSHLYMQSVIRLMSVAATWDVTFLLGLLAHDSLVPRSRNKIFATFLDQPDITHLFFIDADIAFEPEAVLRMLDFDQDLVAGMYPLKVIHWPQVDKRVKRGEASDALPQAGLNYVGVPCAGAEREAREGFVTGTYAGTGFMMMKRCVAERMAAGYPETKFKSMQTYPPSQSQSPNLYNIFDCQIDPETGTYLSEDFTFCKRWKALGGKIWLDEKTRLTHVGNYAFEGNPATREGA
jgi:hypothetical protein